MQQLSLHLVLANKKGNLTRNSPHQKSLEEPQLFMFLCFCAQKDRVAPTVLSGVEADRSGHQPSRTQSGAQQTSARS